MSNEKPLSVQRDEERMRNLAPRRDADKVSEADVFAGAPQARDAERVRQIERARYADWHRRRYGRAINESEYPTELQNDGGAA